MSRRTGSPLPSRRDALRAGLHLAGAAALGPVASALGCRAARLEPGRSDPDAPLDESLGRPPADFPLLEAAGSHYALGEAVGRRFRHEVRTFFHRRRAWFDGLARFAENDGRAPFERLLEAARIALPDLFEESRGLADGAGVPWRELQVLHCKSELEAIQRSPEDHAGCSTLVVTDGERLTVAHNEDGDGSCADLVFLVRLRPPSGVSFLALAYPGILPGNGPALNDRGLVMTTNYIGARVWRPGIPRYFLDRAALEARSVDEALAIVQHPDRAYACHHILAEHRHGRPRAVSVEITATRSQVRELGPSYVHTNHLILEDVRGEAQVEEYVAASSLPRLRTLTAAMDGVADPGALSEAALVEMLSSHQGRPYSPCRHPQGDVRGATLACAVFDVPAARLGLFAGNPCRGARRDYAGPEPTDVA